MKLEIADFADNSNSLTSVSCVWTNHGCSFGRFFFCAAGTFFLHPSTLPFSSRSHHHCRCNAMRPPPPTVQYGGTSLAHGKEGLLTAHIHAISGTGTRIRSKARSHLALPAPTFLALLDLIWWGCTCTVQLPVLHCTVRTTSQLLSSFTSKDPPPLLLLAVCPPTGGWISQVGVGDHIRCMG
jgi:hypothetical protein